MKIILLITMFTTHFLVGNSQNSIYVGSKEYASTPSWKFEQLNLAFGKSSSNAGFLLATVTQSLLGREYFGNVLYVYLQNGKCLILNKLANDRVNGDILATYSVNSTNLNLLKNSDIRKVRFNIRDEFGNSDNFICTNDPSPQYYDGMKIIKIPKESSKTAIDISNLY